jgi:hypothetical protein
MDNQILSWRNVLTPYTFHYGPAVFPPSRNT